MVNVDGPSHPPHLFPFLPVLRLVVPFFPHHGGAFRGCDWPSDLAAPPLNQLPLSSLLFFLLFFHTLTNDIVCTFPTPPYSLFFRYQTFHCKISAATVPPVLCLFFLQIFTRYFFSFPLLFFSPRLSPFGSCKVTCYFLKLGLPAPPSFYPPGLTPSHLASLLSFFHGLPFGYFREPFELRLTNSRTPTPSRKGVYAPHCFPTVYWDSSCPHPS